MPTFVDFLIQKEGIFHGWAFPLNCNAYKCSARTSGGSKSVTWRRVGKGETTGHKET